MWNMNDTYGKRLLNGCDGSKYSDTKQHNKPLAKVNEIINREFVQINLIIVRTLWIFRSLSFVLLTLWCVVFINAGSYAYKYKYIK
jgi:hypothetical protein